MTPAPAMVMDQPAGAAEYLVALRSDALRDEPSLLAVLDLAESSVHGQPEVARSLATQCVRAAVRHGLPAVSARAHYIVARILAERGELPPALASIARARADWQRSGDGLHALRTDLGRMQILDDLGRHREALDVGRSLLTALDADAESDDAAFRDELRAKAWNNLGVAHSFLGDHDETIEAYAIAEARYTSLGLIAAAAKTCANRGIELLEVGRAREALRALSDARQRFADVGDRMWDAKCRGNLAQAHGQLGEIDAALREIAIARQTLNDLQARAESARLQAIGARLYLAVGLHREACGEAADAVEFLLPAGMLHDAATASLTCAQASLAIGDLDAAQPWLARARQLFGVVGDRQAQAQVIMAEADAAALAAATADAIDLAERAVAHLRSGNWLVPLTWAMLRLADLAPNSARAEGALATAASLVAELQLPALRYAFLLRRARQAHGTADDPRSAEHMLREAIEIIEQVGATLMSAELRIAFRDDHMAAHDALVDLLVSRGDIESITEAAAVADRAKAQTLNDLAAGSIGGRWSAAPREADTRIARLRADLSSTYHALHEHADQRGLASLHRRASDLERELTVQRLEAATADAQARDRRGLSAATPGREESAPRPPTLSYHFAGNDLIIFADVDGARSTQRVVDARPIVDAELDRLNAQWSRFRLGSLFVRRHEATLLATARASLGRLYDVLIAPVHHALRDTGSNELTIVPHRRLHQVPFAALHDGVSALARTWSITLQPTVGDGTAPRRAMEPGELTLFAVPDDATPSIVAEAQVVAATWPSVTSRVGSAATSTALRTAVPGPAIVHIACHAQYRQTNPMFSALRLFDRWITASEVLELDFGGALVTLSACESGRHASDSVEPVGLAWAFLAAGARDAVVSHWVVDDTAATQLMSALYRALAGGVAPAAALRMAQLDVASRFEHPYYWAAFSYVAAPSADRSRR